MLNKVILMGRITHDLELRQTPNGVSVLSFSVAVDRNYARQGEDRQTDFIDCVAWRQTGEFISRYFGKGRMIAIEGTLQTRNYQDKNGNNRKAVEVVVDNASFTGEPRQQGQGGNYGGGYQQNSYNGGGYQQNGGYQNNGYQNNGYQNNNAGYQNPAPAPQQSPADQLNIGGIDDFEVLSDDGVPF
ncbi:MAG: single-stranded DNA-binding protein [Ruminococcus sp.]|nr:single-stranded DNA-binding protein [Ruminococcus sp.]